ncbi:hypothetical protein GIB67_034656 [Kingdonia uniflora]|uniref:C2H2-type domain-containing protein n=1 Tax=Kingdonia uniflora TaxID=39325 RepID=A0A7J7P0T3_9MAGN|nr:hypothetical protein GIB67_034656 [Kingdonia uniflora]
MIITSSPMDHRFSSPREEPINPIMHCTPLPPPPPLPDWFPGGYMGCVDEFPRMGFLRGTNPLSFREAAIREIEKEKIRQEIIATEMSGLSKRAVLEAEVRREMAIERDFGLHRIDGFPLVEPLMLGSPRMRLGPIFEPFGLYEDGNRSDDRFGFPVGRQGVGSPEPESLRFLRRQDLLGGIGRSEMLPFQRRREFEARITKLEENAPVSAGGQPGRVVIVTPGSTNLTGAKRKAPAELAKGGSMKTPEKNWFCDVCDLNMTGEQALNDHLSGKKHKAKKELLNSGKFRGKNKFAPDSSRSRRGRRQ